MRRSLIIVIIAGLSVVALVTALACFVIARNAKGWPDGSGPVGTMPPHEQIDTTIVRVVDGDTVVADVEGRDERVRLIGVDTPETVSPSKPVQCYGPQASSHLKALLPKGTAVRLVTDAETHDVYGRLLAYVYRRSDGLFVDLELARDGYASLLTIAPNDSHASQFAAAVDSARDRHLGLWGTCGGPGVPLSAAQATSGGGSGSGG